MSAHNHIGAINNRTLTRRALYGSPHGGCTTQAMLAFERKVGQETPRKATSPAIVGPAGGRWKGTSGKGPQPPARFVCKFVPRWARKARIQMNNDAACAGICENAHSGGGGSNKSTRPTLTIVCQTSETGAPASARA